VPKEACDHLGLALQAAKLAAGQAVQVGDLLGQRVLHGPFDAGIALLLGIELRDIGRQVGHRIVLRVRSNEGVCRLRAVRVDRSQITSSGAAIWRWK
jgi:hypothetical protein